ncbi:MAG: hypothetical protein IJ287_02380 [Methanobrevibacter sp.]|nr:hypothetical protein [Methanobrevibacter sp.]
MIEYSDAKFKKMQAQMQEYFDDYFSREDCLFTIDCDDGEVWNLYLESFPDSIKGIYHEKPWHDCQRCLTWFRTMANVVMIDDDYEIRTLFGFKTIPEYQDVFNTLDEFLKTKSVENIFLHDSYSVGVFRSFAEYDGEFDENHHFYLDLPDKFYAETDELPSMLGDAATQRKLLEDTLNAISIEAVDTVLELVYSNNLYRSNQWKDTLEELKDVLGEFNALDSKCDLNNWLWKKSALLPRNIVHIKNTSMGTMLLNIAGGMSLDEAVLSYEKITDPTRYQRPKAVYSPEMLEDAERKVTQLGYIDSLPRRFARLEDISINNVLFANRNVRSVLAGGIFEELKRNASRKVHDFRSVSEISLDDFIANVLPNAQEISLYVDLKFKNNFVSLISPLNSHAPSMFHWDNPYSWTYENNITDSIMKDLVKKMGGDVDVDLRFSIQWNDGIKWDKNDLDAHSTEPNGHEIYFNDMKSRKTGGWLDVDIINPEEGKIAVENIQYKNKSRMIEGEYVFRVHQYNYRGGDEGFKAEVEFDGKIYSFDYPHKLSQNEFVEVAKVEFKNGKFTLTDLLSDITHYTDCNHWNVPLGEFVPVSLICYSPNYWNGNEFGNKHIFFMLKDCINDTNPSGWFNEYLKNELHPHRKVMEAMSSKIRVEDTENQLSGIGFSLGKLGERKITVKVTTDNIKRIWNVIL